MKILTVFFLACYGLLNATEAKKASEPVIPVDSLDIFRTSLLRQFTSECEPDIFLSTIESSATYLYWASNIIQVQDNYRIVVNSGSDITMKAGYVIVLKPHTAILRGNRYLARIEACEIAVPCTDLSSDDFPRGISPNNDGDNDVFDLSLFCIGSLKIFNRYGQSVYEAENYTDQWHGQSDSGELPTGTYYYSASLTTGNSVTGWVYLQR